MPFEDPEIRIRRADVAIAILALAGIALVVWDLRVERDDLGFISVPLFCSACLIRIRTMLCAFGAKWKSAFDMGVVVGREQEREVRLRSLR